MTSLPDERTLPPLRVSNTIRLEPLRYAHVPDIFRLIDQNRTHLRRWLPFVDHTRHERDTRAFVSSVLRIPPERREYIALIRHEEAAAGLIGTRDTDRQNRKTEVGYWLAADQEGQGLMLRAVQTLLGYLFERAEINAVRIRCGLSNDRSRAIPQKLGFHLEGIERNGELLNGQFHDLEVWSLLRREWPVDANRR
ncbi:MAG: GNAT family N-acetyltransferase [Catalinimonas sp.]